MDERRRLGTRAGGLLTERPLPQSEKHQSRNTTMNNTLFVKSEAASPPLKDIPNQLSQCASDLGRGVLRLWHAYRAHREHRAAKAQLMALDDHMLKDIGLDRSEIDSVLLDTSQDRRRSTRPSMAVYF
jgi:uncharacterized protein YjiS (DUF1127 family)